MTLVLNLLQQLNGNKIMNIILVLCILFSSCGNFSNKTKTNYPPPVITKKSEVEYDVTKSSDIKKYYEKTKKVADVEVVKKEIEEDKKAKLKEKADTYNDDILVMNLPAKLETKTMETETAVFNPDTSALNYFEIIDPGVTKMQYNIAILMPFKASDYVNASRNDSLLKKTKMALELYEGVLLGIEHLKEMGSNVNVYVYDTENSESTTQNIVSQLYGHQLDMIIGPVYNKNLRIVAQYAKNNGIPLVSPLSPSTTITKDNAYYFIVNSGIRSHTYRMLDFISGNFPGHNVLTLSRGNNKEIMLSDAMETYAFSNPNIQMYQKVFVNYETELEDYIDSLSNTVVIVPSFNELFVNETLRRLNILAQTRNITVFGMPNWVEMESVDLDYLEKLNFHYTSDFWVNQRSPIHSKFENLYKSRYKTKPSEYAYKGYDLMLFFGKMLDQYGTGISYNISNPNHKGIYNDFMFRRSGSNVGYLGFDFFENKYVHILKFKNFNVYKVN